MTNATGYQALCNECGTLRVLATLADTAGGTSQLGEPRRWGAAGVSGDRCMIRRKCATCGPRTRHAYIYDDENPNRDHAEKIQAQRPDLPPEQRLEVSVRQLNEMGVRTESRDLDDRAACIRWWLDDGLFAIDINANDTPEKQLEALGLALDRILAADQQWYVWPADDLDGALAGVTFMWT
jgi:hypothetical protein